MNRKILHESEMRLALLFDEGKLKRSNIIDEFTNLMAVVE